MNITCWYFSDKSIELDRIQKIKSKKKLAMFYRVNGHEETSIITDMED